METTTNFERIRRARPLALVLGTGLAALTLTGCSDLVVDKEMTVLERYEGWAKAASYSLTLEQCDRFDSPEADDEGCITEVRKVDYATYSNVEIGDVVVMHQGEDGLEFQVVE